MARIGKLTGLKGGKWVSLDVGPDLNKMRETYKSMIRAGGEGYEYLELSEDYTKRKRFDVSALPRGRRKKATGDED